MPGIVGGTSMTSSPGILPITPRESPLKSLFDKSFAQSCTGIGTEMEIQAQVA